MRNLNSVYQPAPGLAFPTDQYGQINQEYDQIRQMKDEGELQDSGLMSLDALSRATNTDPSDTSEGAIKARSQEKFNRQQAFEREKVSAGAIPSYAQSQYNSEWGPWFEAMEENAQRISGQKNPKMKMTGLDALPTDTQMGTLPLSLQGLQGATYGYDEFGFPTSVSMGRTPNKKTPAQQQAAAQPKPWSLG